MNVEVNQVWARKVPSDPPDGWDRVTVVGVQSISAEQPDEWVIRGDGLETVQVAAADLESVFAFTGETAPVILSVDEQDPRSEWAK